jgi:hypothetical protein
MVFAKRFRRLALLACFAALLLWAATGFQFSDQDNQLAQSKAFDAQLARVEAEARCALESDGSEYSECVERIAETLKDLEAHPFYAVLRSEAQVGSEDRLKALGALLTMRAVSAEMLESSLEQESKKKLVDTTTNLSKIVRGNSTSRYARNWSFLMTTIVGVVGALIWWEMLFPVRKERRNQPVPENSIARV